MTPAYKTLSWSRTLLPTFFSLSSILLILEGSGPVRKLRAVKTSGRQGAAASMSAGFWVQPAPGEVGRKSNSNQVWNFNDYTGLDIFRYGIDTVVMT